MFGVLFRFQYFMKYAIVFAHCANQSFDRFAWVLNSGIFWSMGVEQEEGGSPPTPPPSPLFWGPGGGGTFLCSLLDYDGDLQLLRNSKSFFTVIRIMFQTKGFEKWVCFENIFRGCLFLAFLLYDSIFLLV